MRSICYVSGTRADFGLMKNTLQLIEDSNCLELSICVTGMHLSSKFGSTVNEIQGAGFRVAGYIHVDIDEATGCCMAKSLGQQVIAMTDLFTNSKPDLILLLGDRGEMLAGAIAAIHLNIPVVHIHGGELSGTVDESIRHAISKLSHYHFTSTLVSKNRLIKMGELPENIFVTGAPGLDGLIETPLYSRQFLCDSLNFDVEKPLALIVFHPVVQTAADSGKQMREVLDASLSEELQVLVLMPNSDSGGDEIRNVLSEYEDKDNFHVKVHLERSEYLSWLSACDVLIGNSSSGIIEAASFHIGVVNVGDRQRRRERNVNVIDVVEVNMASIKSGIKKALSSNNVCTNVYGDGKAGKRIVEKLETLKLDIQLLNKCNAY